jgi:hypothetical protein
MKNISAIFFVFKSEYPKLQAMCPASWIIMAKGFALLLLLTFAADAFAQVLAEPRTLKINSRVFALLGPIQHAK